MSLWDKIKSAKPKELELKFDGLHFVVVGMSAADKSDLVASCTDKKGNRDGGLMQRKILARCVHDADRQPVQPDFRQWGDIPSHVEGPLVAACAEVCGFDDDEIERIVKDCGTTGD